MCSIVREPSPILFAALHYTMNDHFDMDEVFRLLVEANTKVRTSYPYTIWQLDMTLIGSGISKSDLGSPSSSIFTKSKASKYLSFQSGLLHCDW